MFKRNLIRKIEKYLSREYLDESSKLLQSVILDVKVFKNEGDLFECEEENYNDALVEFEERESPVSRQIEPPHPQCPKRLAQTSENVTEKRLSVPDFLRSKSDVEKYIDESLEETTFAKKLNQYMYEKDLTTGTIYQRCLVDRKLISKITTQEEYHPSKSTVLALCIGLRLSLSEGEEFLSLAGYSFNRSSKHDLIIKFMLENRIYDLDTINEVLIHFKQPSFE